MISTRIGPSSATRAGLLVLLVVSLHLGGCSMVKVKSLRAGEYIAMTRGDILTTGRMSIATLESLRVIGLEERPCRKQPIDCIETLRNSDGLTDEQRLAALAEVWLQAAITRTPRGLVPQSDEALDAWLEVARHAYAYLFFTARTPGERAFEERQAQIRDYYNFAVEQAVTGLFRRLRPRSPDESPQLAGWSVSPDVSRLLRPDDTRIPRELIPASSLSFEGLRSIYRRDGFGAELVAALDPAQPPGGTAPPYTEMPNPPATVLLRFRGENLEQVLATHQLQIVGYDPYLWSSTQLHGQHIPLAGNFSAGYGLWLARSGFFAQSLRTLLGRAHGIDTPVVYLMQPYDPQRRILLMLHGLAGSPETWVNVANEVLGDDSLRQHYQVWQVYYPTNTPIPYNNVAIREALVQTLRHFDAAGTAPASHDMVVIGHSMGGVLARLMVSSGGNQLWTALPAKMRALQGQSLVNLHEFVDPMLNFAPLPNISRVIFIATPHRGTPIAAGRIGRFAVNLVKLPATLLRRFNDEAAALVTGDDTSSLPKDRRIPNSIDNLKDSDPFIRAAATLQIAPSVRYHSIIARRNPAVPLQHSDDGVVPYWSAHMDGAVSEKVISFTHGVQETPQAIVEIRRILHEHLDSLNSLQFDSRDRAP